MKTNGTYLDAVLDREYMPKFNGLPDEVAAWLKQQPIKLTEDWMVCVGETLTIMSIPQYLRWTEKE